jgi:hypothetical protein
VVWRKTSRVLNPIKAEKRMREEKAVVGGMRGNTYKTGTNISRF